MAPPLALDRPPVRKGQLLTYEGLREEAAEAVRLDRRHAYQIADALGVSPGSLSNALNNAGPRYWKLQVRVLALLRPEYVVRDVGGFAVDRAPEGEGGATALHPTQP